MAGVIPLRSVSRLASPSLSRGLPADLISSSSACARLQGQQRHSDGAFGASVERRQKTVPNSRRTERMLARSQTTGTEQKPAEVSTPPDVGLKSELSSEAMRGSKANPYADIQVGEAWRDIQGAKLWEGLLDPLDNVLRAELIRYGEFTQAMYDSFDYDLNSPFCGSCKYNKSRLFEKLGMENRGYEVTDYLYATAGEGIPLAQYFTFMMPGIESVGEETKDDAWDLESNWIGFVAVTTDPAEIKRLGRRDIVIVWRGTATKLEWIENFQDYTVPSGLDPREAGQKGVADLKIEAGFLSLYKSSNAKSRYTKTSARRQVLEAILRLVKKYGDEDLSISVTGHSLGAALALISAYDIAETGVNQATQLPEEIPYWDEPKGGIDRQQVVDWTRSDEVKTVPVTVYTFGGPRVGNDAFRDRTEELGVKVLRVENIHDKIPLFPGLVFNEKLGFLERFTWLWNFLDWLPWTYTHVGVPLKTDSFLSPYLKKSKNIGDVHNLEGYMHVLTGFHSLKKPFAEVIIRDHALVNKSCDYLNLRIPPLWWQDAYKGMIQTEDGRWAPRPREAVDHPDYDLDDGHAAADSLPPSLSSIQ